MTAGLITAVIGGATVAFGATGGASLLGFRGSHHAGPGSFAPTLAIGAPKPRVVTRTKNVYDTYVVGGSDANSVSSAGAPPIVPPTTAAPWGVVTPPAPAPANGGAPAPAGAPAVAPQHTDSGAAGSPPENTPTTVSPLPPAQSDSSTTIPTTPTTMRGVPPNWPANVPIPPMPNPCREPELQLETNQSGQPYGVWHCSNPGTPDD
ncbi:MAG TPA: hypothetical protein VN636_05460 [Acidimicrobiia bacterium]|nr:hypothetical protein [Acidimicrobiia bacterium]